LLSRDLIVLDEMPAHRLAVCDNSVGNAMSEVYRFPVERPDRIFVTALARESRSSEQSRGRNRENIHPGIERVDEIDPIFADVAPESKRRSQRLNIRERRH